MAHKTMSEARVCAREKESSQTGIVAKDFLQGWFYVNIRQRYVCVDPANE